MLMTFSAYFGTISAKQNANSYSLMYVGPENQISFSQRYEHAGT